MYRTITKQLSFALVVLGLTATLALAQAGGGVGAAGGQGTMGTGSGAPDNRGMTGNTGPVDNTNSPRAGGEISNKCEPGTGVGAVPCRPTSGSMERDNRSQTAEGMGSTQLGEGIPSECEPGTGVGAVPCTPKSGSKGNYPPGTRPQSSGQVK